MRRAFANILTSSAELNDKMIFVTGDLGFQVFTDFETRFPERYVNAGVAEAQMVCFASGLALEGFQPVVYSIASFATGRAFEQIRISIGYQQLPVIVVGAGGGLIYSTSGVTHHALEDFSLMSSIPGMLVFNPGDPEEMTQLFPQILSRKQAAYVRIGKFGEPSLNFEEPIILGKARVQKGSTKTVIFSTGDCSYTASQAIKLLSYSFEAPTLIHFHSLTPFDKETTEKYLSACEHAIIIEEHFPSGGLYSRILELVPTLKHIPKITRRGPDLKLVLGNPRREEVAKHCGYDLEGITSSIQEFAK